MFPFESSDTPCAKALPAPPRYVENTGADPLELSSVTKALTQSVAPFATKLAQVGWKALEVGKSID